MEQKDAPRLFRFGPLWWALGVVISCSVVIAGVLFRDSRQVPELWLQAAACQNREAVVAVMVGDEASIGRYHDMVEFKGFDLWTIKMLGAHKQLHVIYNSDETVSSVTYSYTGEINIWNFRRELN